MRPIGGTDLAVFPLCLGGNIFGWTIDEAAVVRRARRLRRGRWQLHRHGRLVLGLGARQRGGESETIIGNWMAARGNRDGMVIATKVGRSPGLDGPGAGDHPPRGRGLPERLRHRPHRPLLRPRRRRGHPLAETLGAFDDARSPRARCATSRASNYSAPRLAEALALAAPAACPRTSRCSRTTTSCTAPSTKASSPICARARASAASRTSRLASGFLTGKYRIGGADADSPRAGSARSYLDERGTRGARGARRDRRGPRRRASRRSHWRGSPPSRPWPRRSPAPARRSSSPSCCRWATWS